jgi:putative transposase
MARPLRIQYPGALYHVTCRGNEQRDIFRDDLDRGRFLQILAQSLTIYTIQLHSYVLMSNHFHLLLETPLGNLSEFMRHFNISYTGYFNRRHRRTGHLYQGRYRSLLVDKDAYLTVLSRYLHLNPVRIRTLEKRPLSDQMKYLTAYPWSSLPGYLSRREKAAFVHYALVLSEYGGDTDGARKAYRQALYQDLVAGIQIKDKVLGQSLLGGEEFIEWVRERFLKGEKDRERPSLKQIPTYRAKDAILRGIEEEAGKKIETIAQERRPLRQMVMELLYRRGGLKGKETGRILGVGYTSVSRERRRLRERLSRDRELEALMQRIEEKVTNEECYNPVVQ